MKYNSLLGISVAVVVRREKRVFERPIRLQEWLVAGDASTLDPSPVEPNRWTQEVSGKGSSSHSIDSPRTM
jgi:hypothetical protein